MLGTAWTLAVLAAPAALHPCPAHGAGHAAHDAPVAADAPATDPHAGHGAHAVVDTGTASDTESPVPPCQCLDCCCTPSPVAARVETTMVAVAVTMPDRRATWRTPDTALVRSHAVRLPFANGPPALNS